MADEESQMGAHNDKEGRVMVCTAHDCKWNEATRCTADAGIMVNFHGDHADCVTYTRNQHIPSEIAEDTGIF